MLIQRNPELIAAVLTAPAAYQKVGAEYGLTGGHIRLLLAITTLAGEYSSTVTVSKLVASKLMARTRLRDYTRALSHAGYISRRVGRFRVHELIITAKGKHLIDDCMLATRQSAYRFLHV